MNSYDININKVQKFENLDFDILFDFLGYNNPVQLAILNYYLHNAIDNYLEDICINERTDEVIYLGHGRMTLAWQIGSKVFKIGYLRRNSTLPYHHFLLQPILIKELSFLGINLTFEVTHKAKVLTDSPEDIAKVKQVCDYLAQDGIRMFDKLPNNFGILLDSNEIHYESINFSTASSEVSSIDYNNENKILPKGELCILDLDSLSINNIFLYLKYMYNLGIEEDTLREIYDKYTFYPDMFDKSYIDKTFEDIFSEIKQKQF